MFSWVILVWCYVEWILDVFVIYNGGGRVVNDIEDFDDKLNER